MKETLERVGQWEKRDELQPIFPVVSSSFSKLQAQWRWTPRSISLMIPKMIKVVVSVIKELRDKSNTVILVEHNMELIRELSDHCVVMDAEKLLAEGKPEEVLARKVVAHLGE